MAIGSSPVQSNRGAANTASVVVSWPGATTAGNTLLVWGYTNGNAGTQTCSGYTNQIDKAYSGTGQSITFWTKIADGTETSVTLGGNTICRCHIAEWAGLANPIVTDGSNTNTGTTVTTLSTNSITTTNAADLILVGAGTSAGETGTRSWSASFTTMLDDAASPRLLSGYQVETATGSYSSTATIGVTGTNTGTFIIALKGAAAAVTAPTYITYTPPFLT